MPWSKHRRAVLAGLLCVVAAPTVAACSVEATLPPPGCNAGSGLIAAQSVPSAQLLPCLEDPPEGWSVATVSISQDGTVVRLDSDRAGEGAATLRFEDDCDIGVAVSVPSDLPPAERFDDIERLQPGFKASVFYRFEGGCVSWFFDFDDDASATESVALEDTLTLIDRQDVNDQLRETFIDEEL